VDAGYFLKEVKATMTIKVVQKYKQTMSKYSPSLIQLSFYIQVFQQPILSQEATTA